MCSLCQYREQIPKLLFDELPPGVREELETHLNECPACQQEHERLAHTLAALQGWEDLPPPRHFLIEEPGAGPRVGVGQVTPGVWKGAVAASILALIVLSVAFFSGLQVSARPGALTLAWNAESPPTLGEVMASPEFQNRLAQLMDARLEQQAELLRAQLLKEFEQVQERLASERQGQLQVSLAALENRLKRTLEPRVEALANQLVQTDLAVQALSVQQEQSFKLLRKRIDLVAVSGELQGSQNDLLMTTLIDIAAERNQSSREGL